ncbi:hypothetical protein JJB11_21315 [Ramlibacter ginsenosidimutans]|uniref:Uncharacterized protein n=1 Tax=Ramlibacter ginsenosidimutans TaxID=502333 RepID=A0A934TW95_9BURK|nr:hypothetical protein [Ramlibacter ginsenosidimutans]MBK6008649.1 hypothetical protein [Ramlibacter ginsenosidimutans]
MPQENTTETQPPQPEKTRRERKVRRQRQQGMVPVGRGTRHLLPESLRHMQELFELLPQLKVDASGAPDVRATDQAVLGRIAEHAQASAAAINLGMSAVGSLMAYAAPQCEDRAISSDAVEALGWLLAELGATTALMVRLAAVCGSSEGMRVPQP